MILKYNRYIKNILTISRVETGDFPFIIKDLRQMARKKLSIGFDTGDAKDHLPPPHAKYFGTPTLSYTL
jgi:hypothetical protein